jgi:hypothetical protein
MHLRAAVVFCSLLHRFGPDAAAREDSLDCDGQMQMEGRPESRVRAKKPPRFSYTHDAADCFPPLGRAATSPSPIPRPRARFGSALLIKILALGRQNQQTRQHLRTCARSQILPHKAEHTIVISLIEMFMKWSNIN